MILKMLLDALYDVYGPSSDVIILKAVSYFPRIKEVLEGNVSEDETTKAVIALFKAVREYSGREGLYVFVKRFVLRVIDELGLEEAERVLDELKIDVRIEYEKYDHKILLKVFKGDLEPLVAMIPTIIKALLLSGGKDITITRFEVKNSHYIIEISF